MIVMMRRYIFKAIWCMHGTQNCNESGKALAVSQCNTSPSPALAARCKGDCPGIELSSVKPKQSRKSGYATSNPLRYCRSLPLLLVAFTSALKVCSVMHICLNTAFHMPVARSCDLFSNGNMELNGIIRNHGRSTFLSETSTFSDLAWSVQKR